MDKSVERELNRFLLKGQQRSASAMVPFCVFVAAAQIVFILSSALAKPPSVLLILPAIFLVVAAIEWLYARQIGRHLREGQGLLHRASLITAICEASLPSTGVVLFHFVLGWEEALRSPPVFGYFIMLVLSAHRLDARLSVIMGLIEAATHAAIILYAIHSSSPVSPLQIRFSISNVALILVSTVVVAVTIRFTRRLVVDLISSQRDQVAIEKKLATTAEAHQRAEEMIWHKDRLLAILGHDLRTPLNGVAGLAELMARAPEQFTAEEIRRYAGEIHLTSRHLRELVENLLAWAQLRTGQMDLQLSDCVLAELIAQSCHLHESAARSKDVRMLVDTHDAPAILSDVRRIQIILRNLISNAVKFTPAGGVVSVVVLQEACTAAIFVRNSGATFPKELAQQINQGLAVRSNPGTNQETGMGIGLLLCRELTLALGGTLEFTNESGGAVVTLKLPPEPTENETRAEWQKRPDR